MTAGQRCWTCARPGCGPGTETHLLQLHSKPKHTRAEGLRWCFPEDNTQMANKGIKRCSKSLIIREIQVRATLSYGLMTFRRAPVKKTQAARAGALPLSVGTQGRAASAETLGWALGNETQNRHTPVAVARVGVWRPRGLQTEVLDTPLNKPQRTAMNLAVTL